MTTIDLHVHSTASDGELPPAEVARRAAAAGLDVIALTDHDTTDGVPAALAAGAPLGLRVIAGCEFSVAAPWGEMHLLGYFLPPADAGLASFLAAQRARRVERMEEIVRRLQRAGVTIAFEDVRRIAGTGALGRPHAARALLDAGVVDEVQEAFDRFLGRGRVAYVPKELPSIADVTAAVRAVGGVTSAAHLGTRATTAAVRRLKSDGVDGVEVWHPVHDDVITARILRVATTLGMLTSGGSDWHGDRAARGRGAGLGGAPVPAEALERLDRAHAARRREEGVRA